MCAGHIFSQICLAGGGTEAEEGAWGRWLLDQTGSVATEMLPSFNEVN